VRASATYLLLAFLFFLKTSANAQYIPISPEAEVSILTIGPGAELYDKFGHSAFRIKDPVNGYDIVYNYGTYDFNTPNFYTKFARGQLLYELSTNTFENFLWRYKSQNRWVKEQVLQLTYSQKEAVFNYLQNNAKEENKKYKYDFFFDNCATKIRDVLKEVLGDTITYTDDFIEEPMTFRQLIQKNVHANSWGSLGMDVAIGAITDTEASAWEHQFLPDYVFEATAVATLKKDGDELPLVDETNVLYESTPQKEKKNFLTSPFFIFSVLGLLILGVTARDYKNKARSRVLDATLLFVTGLAGLILCFLWFGTDHTATANNYNLLWAFPFSLPIAFALAKKAPKIWVRRYVIFLILLLILLTIHWITGVQEFAIGLLPFFIALAVRYIYVVLYLGKKAGKEV